MNLKRFTVAAALFAVFSFGRAQSLQTARDFYFSGESQKSLKTYEELISAGQDTKDVYLDCLAVLEELSEHEKLLSVASKALRKYPYEFDILSAAARIFLNDGQYKKARVLYDKIIFLSPEPTFSDYINNARAYLGTGDMENAQLYLLKAEMRNKSSAIPHIFLGEMFEKQNNNKSAAESYYKAIEQDPGMSSIRRRLAEIYYKEQNYTGAWEHYKKLALSHPGNKSIKTAMDKVAEKTAVPKEEEIPYEKIAVHRKLAKETPQSKIIKIGIGTLQTGRPDTRKSVTFSPSAPFCLIEGKTNRKIICIDNKETLRIKLAGSKAVVYDFFRKKLASFKNSATVKFQEKGNHTTIIHGLLDAKGTIWANVGDREYRGEMEFNIGTKSKTLIIINHIPIEGYLYSVLPSEMPHTYPIEALKAQAVLARTYATARRGQYRKWGYDLCDSQACQVYKGVMEERPKVIKAVDDTAREILTYKGRAIQAVFSSNTGGMTQSSKNAGWTDYPYLAVTSDYKEDIDFYPRTFRRLFETSPASYAKPQSENDPGQYAYRWSRIVFADELEKKVSKLKKTGKIKAIKILSREKSGYIGKMEIAGEKANVVIDKENKIRKYSGFSSVRSPAFVIETIYKDGAPDYFILYGAGWGHGVGFCQVAAGRRAQAGQNYKYILSHYYPGTKLQRI